MNRQLKKLIQLRLLIDRIEKELLQVQSFFFYYKSSSIFQF